MRLPTTARWGSDHAQAKQEMRPSTMASYYARLRTFWTWMEKNGIIETSAFAVMTTPTHQADQMQPFTDAQVGDILRYLKTVGHPKRDTAIFLLMVDTGLRAQEVVGIGMQHVDIASRRITVLGKGNKRRTIAYGASASRALLSYIREEPREDTQPLFIADRGM